MREVGHDAIRLVEDPVLRARIVADERTLDVVTRELASRARQRLL